MIQRPGPPAARRNSETNRTVTKSVKVALLGCGTVGGGVLRLLRDNAEHLAARVGARIEVQHVLVRDPAKARVAECDPAWVTTDPEVVFERSDVDVAIEVMGGEQPARALVERAIDAGMSVVSANKMLLAKHGPQLIERAAARGVDLAFEASVGGGIPVIRTLRDSLTSDWVSSVHALLNGTCNYILTRMRQEGLPFATALADAQRLGYAEAEPSLDVDGHDASQKLVVLSMLAFGSAITEQVHTEGISELDDLDFRFAERFGFAIKHLAVGIDRGERLELRVHPALVPVTSPLAGVHGVLNGVFIHGRALGPCLLVGQGAGEKPTAVSVVADLVDVARARVEGASGLATRAIRTRPKPLTPMSEVESRYYLRFDVRDQPGVLGAIATELGRRGISVEQMVQEGRGNAANSGVPILIITHRSREGSVQTALAEVGRADFMTRAPRLLRIEEI
jgi:homoserine dehydrogenase